MTDSKPSSSPLGRNQGIKGLLKIARAIIADGRVTPTDVQLFESWVRDNPDMSGTSPVPDLISRFRRAQEPGPVGERGREELALTLRELVGEPIDGHSQSGSVSRPYLIYHRPKK